MTIMKSLLFLVALVAACYADISCPQGACDHYKCLDINPDDCPLGHGEIQKDAGHCGCCPGCVMYLGEGDDCSKILLGGAAIRGFMCRPGLTCSLDTRTCAKQFTAA